MDQQIGEMSDKNVTVKCLRKETIGKISELLNPVKHLRSEEKLSRDWRGLAELCDIESTLLPNIKQSCNQTDLILKRWCEKDPINSTVSVFLEFLERIDRYDIIEDITSLIEEDIRKHHEHPTDYNPETTNQTPQFEILTYDDAKRNNLHQQGPQIYDAFVLFANEDISFATQLINTMEQEFGLKLCVKDRDLMGGEFQNSSIMKIISERCNKLIVVLSDAFLESEQNKFFYNFAQSLQIDMREKKIIPCSCGPVKLPREYSIYVIMDYRRALESNLYNYWERLCSTIKIPVNAPSRVINRVPSIQITPPVVVENNVNGLRSALHTYNSPLRPHQHHNVSFTSVSLTDLSDINQAVNEAPTITQSISASSLDPESATSKSESNKKKNKNILKKLLSPFHKHKGTKVAATN